MFPHDETCNFGRNVTEEMYVSSNAPYQVVYIFDLSHYQCYQLSTLDEPGFFTAKLFFFQLQISYWNYAHFSILIKLSINSFICISKDSLFPSSFSGLLSGIIIINLML